MQIDGSEHRWFEDRAQPCTLLVFIDDASGRLMQLRFVTSESAFAYFEALQGYLEAHGCPIAFYSDKHSVFRVARKEAKGGQGMTQFGRALAELNIEILCANSSQAKGRVERVNRTLQDRLVKELRMAGISDIAAANAFLPGFIERFNARFAVVPERILDVVERVGNAVPHPVVIFVILIGIVIALSALLSALGASVSYESYNAATGKIEQTTTEARSLLTIAGIRFMYTGVVQNFMSFQAVGVIIVAMVGVGVAEESGLIKALIRKLVAVSPAWSLSYILTLVGIISSIAADAGYLVVIPLAAAAFLSVGRNPLAGLALGFAAVASAFLVNALIVPVDGILVGVANDAIALVRPGETIGLLSNQWFEIGSVVLLTILIAQITERMIEPRLGRYAGDYALPEDVPDEAAVEARGLRFALWGFMGSLAFIALLTLPESAPLRDPATGDIIGNTPFMGSLIVSIALIFIAAGAAYGLGAGTMTTSAQVVAAMQKALASLSGLILLLLVISQFLAYFNYSNLAPLAAVSMAGVLQQMNLDALWLLIGFIIVTFVLDLIITGAIPKWAIFAPIFIPLLMRLGVAPDAVLAAYRVGDSPMNAITPLNAYFALIVTFAQRYQTDAGVGTVIALMLPYIVILCVIWTLFFAGWQLLGLPWGL